MVQKVLQHIGGIERYGILSILLFFATFLGIVFWALRLKTPFLNSMAAKPLEDDPADPPSAPPSDYD
ncbi:MAG: cbb3-type cytochrome c oxidase subunit 3 [Verrucomicrobiales bacterium]|nr:cbb3-type cytochrome c oxidase subunit 3 [Verrucomicrobiales bacterium]